MKIHTGDRVQVISGNYRGTIGTVLKAFPKENKLIVENVNIVKKHQKPNQVNPEGTIIEKEAKINASNVMLYDEKAKRADRIYYRVETDDKGNKVKNRYFKKSGNKVEYKDKKR